MRLLDLLGQFRTDANDVGIPPMWGDLDVMAWLAEAEEEACIRARLLFDDATTDLCEIAVTNAGREYAIDPLITEIVYAKLTDAYGMDYPLDLVKRTWLDVQNPDWRQEATRRPASIMHLSKRVAFEVMPDADYTLSLEIYRKPMESLALRNDVTFQDAGDTVTHTAHGHTNGEAVMFAAVNITTGIAAETLYYIRDVAADTYKLCAVPGGAVLPLTTDGNGQVIYLDNEPEIEEAHHRHLVQWALHRAFNIPDADSYDKARASEHMAAFVAQFGEHPGADMRRQQNARAPRAQPTWC